MTKQSSNQDPVTPSFYHWEGDTLILNILGNAGAKKDVIGKVKGHQLKVAVTAAAEAGKATQHMVRFLARQFGVSPSAIEVISGEMNKNKRLRIHSPKKLPASITRI